MYLRVRSFRNSDYGKSLPIDIINDIEDIILDETYNKSLAMDILVSLFESSGRGIDISDNFALDTQSGGSGLMTYLPDTPEKRYAFLYLLTKIPIFISDYLELAKFLRENKEMKSYKFLKDNFKSYIDDEYSDLEYVRSPDPEMIDILKNEYELLQE